MTMKFIMTIDYSNSTSTTMYVVGKLMPMYGVKLKPMYGVTSHFFPAVCEEKTYIHGFTKTDTRTVAMRGVSCSTMRLVESVSKLYGGAAYNSNIANPLIEIKSYYDKDKDKDKVVNNRDRRNLL